MQKTSRSDQRDRLFYYGSRLVTDQMKASDKKYILSPVKVVCIMNYEDSHPGSPDGAGYSEISVYLQGPPRQKPPGSKSWRGLCASAASVTNR